MREIWLDVPGYEGLYQVSEQGRVRSVDREVMDSRGWVRQRRGKVLKPGLSSGYPCVNLSSAGKVTLKRVHRIVLETFVCSPPTPEHECNHIDGDRTNNHVDNLEWVTRQENIDHRQALHWTF